MTDSSIALNRFGLGARPDEAAPADPKRWLVEQFAHYEPRPAALATAPASGAVAADLADYLAQARQLRQQGLGRKAQQRPGFVAPAPTMQPGMAEPPAMADMAGQAAPAASPANDPVKQARAFAARQGRDFYAGAVAARANASLVTPAPFVERLVQFWGNHFAVSADKLTVIGLSGTLEFEAIRPHVLGRFSDMLNAVERHPAMLLYLDQAQSIGPDSPVGERAGQRNPQRKLGLNENLAREIMELHTLGVRSVYTQTDVTEFARAMTGWTVAGLGNGPVARFVGTAGDPGRFVFAPLLHEPGDRTILGRKYGQSGERQAQAVLDDLAAHPATAQHLATKLARHFAGDTPPPAMVARLQQAYLSSGGDLPTVYRAIVASPEAWAPQPVKFRNPWEWSIGCLRALGYREMPAGPLIGLLAQLGQVTWKPGSPAGYDDIAGSWAGPDAVMRRVEAAERFASTRRAGRRARAGAEAVPGHAVDARPHRRRSRAPKVPGQALALLLVSPPMMRR